VGKILQFAPVVSKYSFREYRLPVPVAEVDRAKVGDLIEGRGLVLEILKGPSRTHDKLMVLCYCGKVSPKPTSRYNIKSGKSRSCGHLRSTHAKSVYMKMSPKERRDLFNCVCGKGSWKAAKQHKQPKFVIDIASREYVQDLLEREEVAEVRKVVRQAARFNHGVELARKYFDLSVDEVKAIMARSHKSPVEEEKTELTENQKALLLSALNALDGAADPMFRDLGVAKSSEHLLDLMNDAAEVVALTVNDDIHISTREFATPGTVAAAKSKSLLNWMWKVLNGLDASCMTPALKWLLRTLKLNIWLREARRKDALKRRLKRRTSPSDRFGWKAPDIAADGASAVIRANAVVALVPATIAA